MPNSDVTSKTSSKQGQNSIIKKNGYLWMVVNLMTHFKQGAYNQTNGKDPEKNIVWCGGAETYGGDIPKQYANGSYTEVWFSKASIGVGQLLNNLTN